ncbi:MAG: hypothetical protein HZB85_02480 [Deltaproteobacteria bacterium]|nr:hypothetical protein [Deltaproteobacteria bacterium]
MTIHDSRLKGVAMPGYRLMRRVHDIERGVSGLTASIAMKAAVIFVFIMAAFVFAPRPASAEFKKTKIAVLNFQLQGEGFETQDMGKIVAEWIVTGLVQAGRFNVVERGLLEKILKEQELPMYGIVEGKDAAKTGKIVGAKVVITGSVMKLRDYTEVSARLINVEDGSIIAAEKVRTDRTGKLENLVSEMIDKIILDFPLEGYIVQRGSGTETNMVTVDLGKTSGVRAGKRFLVYKEGKVIKHPKTGEILDVERVELGEIEIRDVKDKTANAVILHEVMPYNIEYGSMVRSAVESGNGKHEAKTYDRYADTPEPEPEPAGAEEPSFEKLESFAIGSTYYLITTIHTGGRKNAGQWDNRIDLTPIKAGEKVQLTAVTRTFVKFKWHGGEYYYVYHKSRVANPALLARYLVKDDPSPTIESYPQDIKAAITQGKILKGMTKWQVLFSVGIPKGAGGRPTSEMPLDEILLADHWLFMQGKFDQLNVKFADDKVILIDD